MLLLNLVPVLFPKVNGGRSLLQHESFINLVLWEVQVAVVFELFVVEFGVLAAVLVDAGGDTEPLHLGLALPPSHRLRQRQLVVFLGRLELLLDLVPQRRFRVPLLNLLLFLSHHLFDLQGDHVVQGKPLEHLQELEVLVLFVLGEVHVLHELLLLLLVLLERLVPPELPPQSQHHLRKLLDFHEASGVLVVLAPGLTELLLHLRVEHLLVPLHGGAVAIDDDGYEQIQKDQDHQYQETEAKYYGGVSAAAADGLVVVVAVLGVGGVGNALEEDVGPPSHILHNIIEVVASGHDEESEAGGPDGLEVHVFEEGAVEFDGGKEVDAHDPVDEHQQHKQAPHVQQGRQHHDEGLKNHVQTVHGSHQLDQPRNPECPEDGGRCGDALDVQEHLQQLPNDGSKYQKKVKNVPRINEVPESEGDELDEEF
mmetsp:Transcript_29253/g.28350  ORF Transcript_29253/g.28350 Transcript_29253/m.28350 type:complete len:425 (+) Transcript_29253:274-1548(+)